MLRYRKSEWTIGRSNQAYHIWYTLGEMLSAIEIVSRWYFFAYIGLDRIPKDPNDFSLAEPRDHARTTDRVLLFCFLHRLCPSELERPSSCCLYIRLRFFLAVHRGSFLQTSASRQWPCHLRIPREAWCSIRLLIFQWIAARVFLSSMCIRVQFAGSAVKCQHFHLDWNDLFLLQSIKNTLYYAVFTPSLKSLVYAVPFAVFFWKCPPFAPVFGDV